MQASWVMPVVFVKVAESSVRPPELPSLSNSMSALPLLRDPGGYLRVASQESPISRQGSRRATLKATGLREAAGMRDMMDVRRSRNELDADQYLCR